MSDPRAVISRTVLAPPTSAAAATLTAAEPDLRLIGKPHGRMRCVNLSLIRDRRVRITVVFVAVVDAQRAALMASMDEGVEGPARCGAGAVVPWLR